MPELIPETSGGALDDESDGDELCRGRAMFPLMVQNKMSNASHDLLAVALQYRRIIT